MTECASPRMPSGASSFMCPRRIFSSFGKGGKKSGGGGWPGASSGMFGGAEVNAERLCAYASSSGYGIAPAGRGQRQRVGVPAGARQGAQGCGGRVSAGVDAGR